MSEEGVGLVAEMAAAVDVEQVHSLLTSRKPSLLAADHADHALYLSLTLGVANEIAPYAGQADTPRRGLALWCLTLGVASQLEAALFPEQQNESGRAEYLEGRYAKVLGQLGNRLEGDAASSVPNDTPEPTGQFPPARGVSVDGSAYLHELDLRSHIYDYPFGVSW